jgi:hypothetical protein
MVLKSAGKLRLIARIGANIALRLKALASANWSSWSKLTGSRVFGQAVSMDGFKGNSTGNYGFYHVLPFNGWVFLQLFPSVSSGKRSVLVRSECCRAAGRFCNCGCAGACHVRCGPTSFCSSRTEGPSEFSAQTVLKLERDPTESTAPSLSPEFLMWWLIISNHES